MNDFAFFSKRSEQRRKEAEQAPDELAVHRSFSPLFKQDLLADLFRFENILFDIKDRSAAVEDDGRGSFILVRLFTNE